MESVYAQNVTREEVRACHPPPHLPPPPPPALGCTGCPLATLASSTMQTLSQERANPAASVLAVDGGARPHAAGGWSRVGAENVGDSHEGAAGAGAGQVQEEHKVAVRADPGRPAALSGVERREARFATQQQGLPTSREVTLQEECPLFIALHSTHGQRKQAADSGAPTPPAGATRSPHRERPHRIFSSLAELAVRPLCERWSSGMPRLQLASPPLRSETPSRFPLAPLAC